WNEARVATGMGEQSSLPHAPFPVLNASSLRRRAASSPSAYGCSSVGGGGPDVQPPAAMPTTHASSSAADRFARRARFAMCVLSDKVVANETRLQQDTKPGFRDGPGVHETGFPRCSGKPGFLDERIP